MATPETKKEAAYDSWYAFKVCALYAIVSICISMMYKALLSSWNFQGQFTLLTGQLGVSLLFCLFAKRFLSSVPGFAVPDVDQDILRESIPMGVLFVLNIVVGWWGLRIVDVPTFLCIRRTTTAFTMTAEWFLLGKVASLPVRLSVVLIVVGTMLTGYETLGRDGQGYLFTLGNNLLTAVQLALSRKLSDHTKVKGFGLVLYNALVALPITSVALLFSGELAYVAQFEHRWNPWFWLAVLAASALGVVMIYAVFLCTTVNSPLATSITGNLKDVFSTFIGAFLFPGFEPTVLKVSGLLLSFCGGGAFALLSLPPSVFAHGGAPPTALASSASTSSSSMASSSSSSSSSSSTSTVSTPGLSPLAPTSVAMGGGGSVGGIVASSGGLGGSWNMLGSPTPVTPLPSGRLLSPLDKPGVVSESDTSSVHNRGKSSASD